MQNQNPLDPLDTNQFTQQLVQFAGVEQQLKTNDQLSSLLTLQQTAQSTQALGFVGKTAVVDGSTANMTNSAAVWDLNVPKASTVNVSITNSTGQTVYTNSYTVGVGDNQTFGWDGKGNDGTQWPDGKYTLTATGTDNNGQTVGHRHGDPGHRQFGGPDPVAAFAVDQRPDLYGQPDQGHRQLAATRFFANRRRLETACPPLALPAPDLRPGIAGPNARSRPFQGDSYWTLGLRQILSCGA